MEFGWLQVWLSYKQLLAGDFHSHKHLQRLEGTMGNGANAQQATIGGVEEKVLHWQAEGSEWAQWLDTVKKSQMHKKKKKKTSSEGAKNQLWERL